MGLRPRVPAEHFDAGSRRTIDGARFTHKHCRPRDWLWDDIEHWFIDLADNCRFDLTGARERVESLRALGR